MNSPIFFDTILDTIDSFLKPTSQKTESEFKSFFEEECGLLFNKAILCGEHYFCSEEAITNLKQKIDELGVATGLPSNTSTQRQWAIADVSKLSNMVKSLSDEYFVPFVQIVERMRDNTKTLLKGQDRTKTAITTKYTAANIIEDVTRSEIYGTISLFRLNILLAYIDEGLQCSEDVESELLYIIENEKELVAKSLDQLILDILLEKAKFLFFKLQFRDKRHRSRINKLGKTTNGSTNSQYFDSFYKLAEAHYFLIEEDKAIEYESEIKKALGNNEYTAFDFTKLYYLKKYYSKLDRKKREAQKKLKELSEKVEVLFNEASGVHFSIFSHNAIAVTTSLFALKSASFVMSLEKEKSRHYKTITQDIEQYIRIGDEHNSLVEKIKKISWVKKEEKDRSFLEEQSVLISSLYRKNCYTNFYACYCYFGFLNDVIKYLKGVAEVIVNFDKNESEKVHVEKKRERVQRLLSLFVKEYDKTFRLLEDSFRFSKRHKSLPAVSPMKACNAEFAIAPSSYLFVKSSYILPINYDDFEKQISSWRASMNVQEISLKDSFEVALNKCEINETITAFEKKLGDNDFRIVQIVAMFVTIATFVLLNVTAFTNKTSFESFGILLGLAACLFLFNLFFEFIIVSRSGRRRGTKGIPYRHILAILLPFFFGCGSYYVLKYEATEDINKRKQTQSELRTTVDSMKYAINSMRDSSIAAINDSMQSVFVEMPEAIEQIRKDMKRLDTRLKKLSSPVDTSNLQHTKPSQ